MFQKGGLSGATAPTSKAQPTGPQVAAAKGGGLGECPFPQGLSVSHDLSLAAQP